MHNRTPSQNKKKAISKGIPAPSKNYIIKVVNILKEEANNSLKHFIMSVKISAEVICKGSHIPLPGIPSHQLNAMLVNFPHEKNI